MKIKLLLILSLTLLFSCKESDKEIIENLEKQFQIENDFKEDYVVKEVEDYDFENSSGMEVKIVVPEKLSKDRIEKNIQNLVLDYLRKKGQIKLHIKVYELSDSIPEFPNVARAEFLPFQKSWDAEDNKYGLRTYRLDINYKNEYFDSKIVEEPQAENQEVEIYKDTKWDKNRKEFVKANSVPISTSRTEWTADKIIVEIPNNSKAKIIDEYNETLADGSHFKRYKVEVNYKGKNYQGWIHSEEVK